MTPGILVVNRLQLLRLGKARAGFSGRVPAREESWEAIFEKYRGFDGVAWPSLESAEFATQDGLASLEDVGLVDAYVAKLDAAVECEVVFLVRDVSSSPVPQNEWFFAGFDLGYFESEWSHFSVVLNEILCGRLPEMRRFASSLNEHLLIGSVDECAAMAAQRKIVVDGGGDLEELDMLEPIAIFVRSLGARKSSVPSHSGPAQSSNGSGFRG